MWAAFSPIIITGAFKLPFGITGIIEASATRKFFMPLTLKAVQKNRKIYQLARRGVISLLP